MEPDELEMQVARAVLAEEQIADQQATIDALVSALEAIRDYPKEGRRTDDGYPQEFSYDEYAYRRMVDSYRKAADAALALARGGK